MQIVVVGCGKVGSALTRKLIDEGHNIAVVDTNAERVRHITDELDVMGVVGNGASISVLSQAGIEAADVFISVTGSDELNLLCCLFAKKAANCHTVARVRNPMYSQEIEFVKNQLGISAIINPELATAREISRLLRFPAAIKIDAFAGGLVNLIKFQLTDDMALNGVSLKEIPAQFGNNILICAVERGRDVTIPSGDFILQSGDIITFLAAKDHAGTFFEQLHVKNRPVKNALLVGGGTIGYYLAKDLLSHHIRVRIVEQNPSRCEVLAELLPEATIIQGDGADRQLLMEEGLPAAEAFVPLTNLDEENVLLTLFAKKHSQAKLVTKINRLEFDDILDSLEIGSVIYPKYITCDFIVQHIRALQNASGNKIKTLYRILDDRVEALEFTVLSPSVATDKALADLKLKPNQLICCITRGNQIIIPKGSDSIQVGDSVVVVTLGRGLQDIRDIVAK
ncbi:MAG: Trk system potassium transporter TrkA [Clostridia bacterium]|nr:Trk system potassium transporter TrkA [Clostridia bacterium]